MLQAALFPFILWCVGDQWSTLHSVASVQVNISAGRKVGYLSNIIALLKAAPGRNAHSARLYSLVEDAAPAFWHDLGRLYTPGVLLFEGRLDMAFTRDVSGGYRVWPVAVLEQSVVCSRVGPLLPPAFVEMKTVRSLMYI